ncbi:MAG: hypothetical protein II447_11670, partial [Bacteroidaceae bacterium]|nr:hypothetical protein [Bacteroidaceae bacterium]
MKKICNFASVFFGIQDILGSAIPNHHLEDNEPTMIRAYAFWRRRFYIIMELVVSLGWRGNCLRLLCVIDVFTNKLIMNTIMKRITKIKLFAMMALFVVLTSCDEQLDNAINASKVTSIAIDFSSI